jgi:hypothetical protein
MSAIRLTGDDVRGQPVVAAGGERIGRLVDLVGCVPLEGGAR